MRKLRLLIAEDEPIIQKMYEQIVSKRDDYELVGMASNGEDEEKMIYELKPDVVITDNQMPKLNGIDVIGNINKSDLAFKPKFILITGDARDNNFLKICEKEEVARVVGKPCPQDLLDFILTDLKVIIEDETPVFIGENSEGWQDMYMHKELVDLKKYFSQDEFEQFKKLGIEIKDKLYTEYEMEVLTGYLYDYYSTDDMTAEEKSFVKSLEGTGISKEQIDSLLAKIEQINDDFEF